MTQEENNNNIININGTDYSQDDLSQEQQYMIAQVRDLQIKAGQTKFQLDQIQVSLDHFTNKVLESIENIKEETTPEIIMPPKQSVN
tara:strand:+ start:2374 stop:2634 length:261 start_codon:yes stop_codon:yes gene_type:complete